MSKILYKPVVFSGDEEMNKVQQEPQEPMMKRKGQETIMDPWRNRDKNMICATCRFHCIKQDTVGRCRKHAPTMNGFPVAFISDWCGDHKIDENKLDPMGKDPTSGAVSA